MKKLLFLANLCVLTSCVPLIPFTRNERFIKQELQKINLNQGSVSTQFKIFSGSTSATEPDASYVEITGYSGEEGKHVVIGYALKSDIQAFGNGIVYKYRIDHISLTVDEAKLIIQKLPQLLAAIPQKPRLYEETVYSDFRISKDLVIGIQLRNASSKFYSTIDFWVKGERIAISSTYQKQIIEKLSLFLNK